MGRARAWEGGGGPGKCAPGGGPLGNWPRPNMLLVIKSHHSTEFIGLMSIISGAIHSEDNRTSGVDWGREEAEEVETEGGGVRDGG